MVAWLFYLGHFLEPLLNAVRWPAVLLGHCTLGLGFLLLKDIFPREKVRLWMYLVLFSPMLGFGSLIITPDLPVLFFWVLSLYYLYQILEHQKPTSYLLLGASLGLGFCAKYHIVLFIPCLLLFLFFEKKWSVVKWRLVSLTLISGLLFSLPVLLWNYNNHFTSFLFQLNHGLERESYDFLWTVSYILGQILIIFPLILWAAVNAKVPPKLRFILYFAWFPLIFFLFTSFRALVEGNWPIIALPGVLILAACHEKIEKWIGYYIKFWTTIMVIVTATLFVPMIRTLDPKLSEPYELKELSHLAYDFSPLYAGTYQMASSIWYFSKKPTFKLRGISRYDFFDTLNESLPKEKKFFLLKHVSTNLPQWLINEKWEQHTLQRIAPNYELMSFTHL
jgi:4-amino-4-deoxy-L-arabinose transferase-like glycosyltransferase